MVLECTHAFLVVFHIYTGTNKIQKKKLYARIFIKFFMEEKDKQVNHKDKKGLQEDKRQW